MLHARIFSTVLRQFSRGVDHVPARYITSANAFYSNNKAESLASSPPLALLKDIHPRTDSVLNPPNHAQERKLNADITRHSEIISKYTNNLITNDDALSSQSSVVKNDVFTRLTKNIDVSGLKPKLPSKSYTLAPYVNESATLSRLVEMGIDITSTEKDSNLANFLLRADFERDLQPIILFLMRDIGLSEEELVKCLSSNLRLLKEHLEDLEARVNFLRYMKFSKVAVQTIVNKNANFLSYPTKDVDKACGFVQRMLSLSGNETRALLTAYPSKKLIYGDFTRTQALVDMLQDIEGFSKVEVKRMCVNYPRLLTFGHAQIVRSIDYIMEEMKVGQFEILACPYVFNTRATNTIIKRHKYLKFISRDQFNPKLANYIPLETLVSVDDHEFCAKLAKTPLKEYYDFQKTL